MKPGLDLLQERLERLEAGESPQASREGLPESLGRTFELAVMLRGLETPAFPPQKAAAQRRAVRKAAREAWRERTAHATAGRGSPRKPWLALAAAMSGVAVVAVGCVVSAALLVAVVQSGILPPLSVVSSGAPSVSEFEVTSQPAADTPAKPSEALLLGSHGLVQVLAGDGTWRSVGVAEVLRAGQRIRTGSLSSATLVFYDGSRADLGPGTEVSLDVLDAWKDAGPRVIQMVQWSGETEHRVAPDGRQGAKYEVRTPTGSGLATGTVFRVLVTTALLSRFDVVEGSVAVTSLDVTVVVVAGQSSTIEPGAAPGEPLMRFSGEGVVWALGRVWQIAAHPMLTNPGTRILGEPQAGDWVSFEGRILADGTRFADRILLLRRVTENTFRFRGLVGSIEGEAWTVAGRALRVTASAQVTPGTAVGDRVEVQGEIREDGTLLAARVRRLGPPQVGRPFAFSGVVEDIGAEGWTVSGVSIEADESTEVHGDPRVGDLVHVEGTLFQDGTWLASEVERAGGEGQEFEFTGLMEGVDPWVVAGIELAIRPWTEIDRGILPGDRVRVEGRLLDDGTWLAGEIERRVEGRDTEFHFAGVVDGLDPWTVSGIALATDGKTEIEAGIAIGDRVRVEGEVLTDGTWLAREIERLDETQGCVATGSIVRSVEADQLLLFDGRRVDLDEDLEIEGEVTVASVVNIQVCASEDGTLTVVHITVIYQLEVLPPPPAHGDEDEDDDEDEEDEHEEGDD